MVQMPQEFGTLSLMALSAVSSYDIFLKEEIEVYRLMLCRDELLSSDPSSCLHCGTILSRINQLENELSDFESQFAA